MIATPKTKWFIDDDVDDTGNVDNITDGDGTLITTTMATGGPAGQPVAVRGGHAGGHHQRGQFQRPPLPAGRVHAAGVRGGAPHHHRPLRLRHRPGLCESTWPPACLCLSVCYCVSQPGRRPVSVCLSLTVRVNLAAGLSVSVCL